jgi:signal transduction histidine kinase
MRKEFAGQMLEAQENERRRIAHELHDDLGQRIVVTSFEIERVAGILRKARHGDAIVPLQNCIADLANTVRAISQQLHPSALEDFGLIAALEHTVEQYRRNGAEVDFRVRNIRSEIPKSLSLPLYRIAQEAIRNAFTHAPGSKITVTVGEQNNELSLVIEDTGPGFDPITIRSKTGLGLTIMQERARLAGCAFVVDGQTGGGTKVAVRAAVGTVTPVQRNQTGTTTF